MAFIETKHTHSCKFCNGQAKVSLALDEHGSVYNNDPVLAGDQVYLKLNDAWMRGNQPQKRRSNKSLHLLFDQQTGTKQLEVKKIDNVSVFSLLRNLVSSGIVNQEKTINY
jgi:hypothetical protein